MNEKRERYFIVLITTLVLLASIVYAVPSGPKFPEQFNEGTSSRLNISVYSNKSVQAEAGNITRIDFNSTDQTGHWQGYYGDISGTITLDDASNYTMYSWVNTEPQGEVYIVNETISDWTTAHCFNYTARVNTNTSLEPCNPGDANCIYYNYTYDGGSSFAYTQIFSNLSDMENFYNLSADDVDGIDETFNETGKLSDGQTNHNYFYVGTTRIDAGTCPATDLYENDSSSGINFQEVLLQVNNSAAIIWTAIIENDIIGNDTDNVGYNGVAYDFQAIVAEDGTSEAGQDTTTQYYFYVELQ
jgi:hypothetical protein